MDRSKEGVSVGSLQREAPLAGYGHPVSSNTSEATRREQERGRSGDRRLGPLGVIEAEGTEMLRLGAKGRGPEQHAWRPGLAPLQKDPYSGQREFGILQQDKLGLHKEGPSTLESEDMGRVRPLTPLSNMSNDRLSYANRARDPPSFPGLLRDPQLRAYFYEGLSILRDQAFYSGVSHERSPFLNAARDLPPHMSLAYADQRRDRSLDIGNQYSRNLSPYDSLTKERSPYTVITKEYNHVGTKHDLPRSSLSVYRKSRSRSPVGNRDLSSLSEVLGRGRSPYSRERSSVLPSENLSRHEILEGSSKRSVRSLEKEGEKQTITGSVVKVEGIPEENKARCVTQILDRLGKYGTVRDVQLHKGLMADYALFYYYEANAAQTALQKVQKNPLFPSSLRLSIWLTEAERDKPLTLALTRVMFLENLEKTVSLEMLYTLCEKVGEILDIELKENPGSYLNTAIVQYWDASNAKFAAQALNLEKIGKCVIKAISGKNTPSNCVWIDGLPNDLDERELTKYFEEFGTVDKHVFNRKRGAALLLFPARIPARQCVRVLENGKATLGGQVIRADYANDRAQLAFCRDMERSGQDVGSFLYA